MKNKCTFCGDISLFGLVRGQGKCAWHWTAIVWGKNWAIKCHGQEPKHKVAL
jgi:hypothetical protein